MKKIMFTLFAVTLLLSAKAQKSDTLKGAAADTVVFMAAQKMPEFPGGMNDFNRYIDKNVQYPGAAKQSKTAGKIIVSILVEKDGSVSRVKVVKGVAPEIDKEVLRVVKASPKWSPGMQNGSAVRVMCSIPVYIDLSGK